jgi:hypothetical protein
MPMHGGGAVGTPCLLSLSWQSFVGASRATSSPSTNVTFFAYLAAGGGPVSLRLTVLFRSPGYQRVDAAHGRSMPGSVMDGRSPMEARTR